MEIPQFDYTNQNHIIFVLLAIIILALLLFILKYKVGDYLNARKIKKRFERGNELELQAKKFLKKKGFTVVDYQSNFEHKYYVDGEAFYSEIQPDYIVTKKGKKYIVEVKSGNTAVNIKNRNTRRQLLEYDYVIENDGVFLLDMENRELKLIEFTPKAVRRSNRLINFIIITALTGIAIPYWQVKVAIGILLGLFLFRRIISRRF